MAVENGDTDQISNQVKELEVTGETAPDEAERSLLQKVIRKGLVENKNDIEVQRKESVLFQVRVVDGNPRHWCRVVPVLEDQSVLEDLF